MIRVLFFLKKLLLAFQDFTCIRRLELECGTYLFLSSLKCYRFDLGGAVPVCGNGLYGIGPVFECLNDLRERGIHYSRVHIYRLVKAGKFPAPIKVGQNRVGWVESEIDDWIQKKVEERDRAA